MVRFSEDKQTALWEMFEAGVSYKMIGRELGRGHSSVRKHIMYAGGKRPAVPQPSELRLSLAEREEISRGLAAGWFFTSDRRRDGVDTNDGVSRSERQRRSAGLSGCHFVVGRSAVD